MTTVVIEWCTNFNGVYAYVEDDDVKVTPEMEKIFDLISDTFPSKTYEWAKPFEMELTDAQETELLNMAQMMLKEVIPDAHMMFRYNDTDS